MSRLFQVVANFCQCSWSQMRIKREKSVTTDFKNGAALPTAGILYAGEPLTGLAAEVAFTYLGVRASLVGVVRSRRRAPPGSAAVKHSRRPPAPCLTAEKAPTKDITWKVRQHKCLLHQMVPAMRMISASRFRYLAPLVTWTDAELNRLY
jgi:hypothetical protein